ncbi:hypothetical protein JNB_15698 [Janibacter sp. HTCC2649]|nr:hypothetical protein JNB_15698 [Janibacter sp. HTCC2649]
MRDRGTERSRGFLQRSIRALFGMPVVGLDLLDMRAVEFTGKPLTHRGEAMGLFPGH